jgi:hypothetical protein
MANKHRGEVEIFLDKKRTLKYNMNALVNLEDELGHSITQIDSENMGIKRIVQMFWAGMLHEMPDLTLKEAADLMDYSSLDEISKKVTEAFELAFEPEKKSTSKKK